MAHLQQYCLAGFECHWAAEGSLWHHLSGREASFGLHEPAKATASSGKAVEFEDHFDTRNLLINSLPSHKHKEFMRLSTFALMHRVGGSNCGTFCMPAALAPDLVR